MRDTLNWLAEFFPVWGVRAFWLALLTLLVGFILNRFGEPLSLPRRAGKIVLWVGSTAFALFLLMAIFFVLAK